MKTRIMLVDDSLDFTEEMRTFFDASDEIEVVGVADNGVKAVELFKTLKPQVMVLDLVMPQMDGFSVLENINKGDCKVIILSALSQDTFISKATSLGADYYMIKPASLNNLYDRILDSVRPSARTANVSANQSNLGSLNSNQSSGGAIKMNKNRSMEEKISNIFITVGIPAHIKGYQFLREAIKMAIDNPEIINSITKRLYPDVAEKFDTSPSKVERAIRHAIEVAWNRGKIENINSLFGVRVYSHNEKPTNGEFIALVADKMLLESV